MSGHKRCAIYTRKSSEEGLEQDFNSLHAQREACESYIKSQKGEGWEALPAHYDDGGFSGGNMQRPALQRLMADIDSGRVDVVVVYKVDRLTRSLSDFAKIVDIFDKHHASFVAVTQQFNTTTSMGRLTLNVLLSFAQFEREVTGERIRDKIAASKKKGMWMGGNIPLGYDLRDRKLIINPTEAETIRHIFRRYLVLKNPRDLQAELNRDGIVSKVHVTEAGNRWGGVPIGRSYIYNLLNNPIYIGAIRHKKLIHPGQHEPIVDRELWDAVQAQLDLNRGKRVQKAKTREINPLYNKLFDAKGERLVPIHTQNHGRKYRYYASPQLRVGSTDVSTTWRLPANQIERAVADAAITMLSDNAALATALREAGVPPADLAAAFDRAATLRERLGTNSTARQALAETITRVEVSEDTLAVTLSLMGLVAGEGGGPDGRALSKRKSVPIELKRRGVEMRIVVEGQSQSATDPNPALLKAIARGWSWFENLTSGAADSIADIAERDGVTDRYVGRLLRLAFLSPEVIEAVVTRNAQLPSLDEFFEQVHIPVEWADQLGAVSIR